MRKMPLINFTAWMTFGISAAGCWKRSLGHPRTGWRPDRTSILSFSCNFCMRTTILSSAAVVSFDWKLSNSFFWINIIMNASAPREMRSFVCPDTPRRLAAVRNAAVKTRPCGALFPLNCSRRARKGSPVGVISPADNCPTSEASRRRNWSASDRLPSSAPPSAARPPPPAPPPTAPPPAFPPFPDCN